MDVGDGVGDDLLSWATKVWDCVDDAGDWSVCE